MKLIMENWRKYLNERDETIGPTEGGCAPEEERCPCPGVSLADPKWAHLPQPIPWSMLVELHASYGTVVDDEARSVYCENPNHNPRVAE